MKKKKDMKVIVIPIVLGALATIPKGLVKGLEDLHIKRPVGIIQTIARIRSTRIQRRVMETGEDLLSLIRPAIRYRWCEEISKEWMNSITEFNEIIYAGAKSVCNKIGVLLLKLKTWTKNWTGNTDNKSTTTSKNAKIM